VNKCEKLFWYNYDRAADTGKIRLRMTAYNRGQIKAWEHRTFK